MFIWGQSKSGLNTGDANSGSGFLLCLELRRS